MPRKLRQKKLVDAFTTKRSATHLAKTLNRQGKSKMLGCPRGAQAVIRRVRSVNLRSLAVWRRLSNLKWGVYANRGCV